MPSSRRYAASHIKQTAGRGHDDILGHEQLALDCNAINLSQGFPSFDPPDDLLSLI